MMAVPFGAVRRRRQRANDDKSEQWRRLRLKALSTVVAIDTVTSRGCVIVARGDQRQRSQCLAMLSYVAIKMMDMSRDRDGGCSDLVLYAIILSRQQDVAAAEAIVPPGVGHRGHHQDDGNKRRQQRK